jgi:oligoribonuclease
MTLAAAQQTVLDYIREWVPEPGKAPLAGNSVGTDKTFLDRDMPELVAHLHYRVIDVSSIKELARRWYPRVYFNAPAKHGGHRALADILESIDELRFYRAALMPTPPGPDSATVKAIAAQIAATSVAAARQA